MKSKFVVIGFLFIALCLGAYGKWMQPDLFQHSEWKNLREDPQKKATLEKVAFPSNPRRNSLWFENRNTPGGISITARQTIMVDHQFSFQFNHDFSIKEFENLGGTFTRHVNKPVKVGMTLPNVPMGKCFYPYVQIQWQRKYYLFDHYVNGVQDKNPARLNSNGEIDATHDGSWEGWVDVYRGGTSVGLSRLYSIDGFPGGVSMRNYE